MRALLLLLVACCLATADAHAEKRVALVIGNSAYEKVARLPNPANDAALMAATLKSAGFDSVDLSQDLKVGDMRRTLRDFIDKAREADIAVIYYAGTASKWMGPTTSCLSMPFCSATWISMTRRCRWTA